jgi:hypothetical protein
MATTRLGVGGPSAAYPGFLAKEEVPVVAAVADYIIRARADVGTVQVRADATLVRVRPDIGEIEL